MKLTATIYKSPNNDKSSINNSIFDENKLYKHSFSNLNKKYLSPNLKKTIKTKNKILISPTHKFSDSLNKNNQDKIHSYSIDINSPKPRYKLSWNNPSETNQFKNHNINHINKFSRISRDINVDTIFKFENLEDNFNNFSYKKKTKNKYEKKTLYNSVNLRFPNKNYVRFGATKNIKYSSPPQRKFIYLEDNQENLEITTRLPSKRCITLAEKLFPSNSIYDLKNFYEIAGIIKKEKDELKPNYEVEPDNDSISINLDDELIKEKSLIEDQKYSDTDIEEFNEGFNLVSERMEEDHNFKTNNLISELNINKDFYPVSYNFSENLNTLNNKIFLENENFLKYPKFSYSEKSQQKFQENCWKNYARIIDKYLTSLVEIRKCRLDELENYRILSEFEMKKKLNLSLTIKGSFNYVSRDLLDDLLIMDEYEENIRKINKNISFTIDNIENQIIEYLKIFGLASKLNSNEDMKINYDTKIMEAYKILDNKTGSILNIIKNIAGIKKKNLNEFDLNTITNNIKTLENFDTTLDVNSNISFRSDDNMINLNEIFHDFTNDENELNFEFPEKYLFSENTKLVYEIPRIDGVFVKFFENFVVEYKHKNKEIHRVFIDGCVISFYPNKDMRIIFPNGDIFYKYKAVRITELNYFNKFSLILYNNGITEKILKEGIKLIKNPNNSEIIIVTLNDEEYRKINDGGFSTRKLKIKTQA